MDSLKQFDVSGILQQESEIRLRSLTTKRWLRTAELALYLGLTEGAVRVMVHRGTLNPRKLGRRSFFSREEVDGLIETSNNTTRRNRWR